MKRRFSILAFTLIAILGTIQAVISSAQDDPGEGPSRVLVAPVAASVPLRDDPIVGLLPALLAEAIGAGMPVAASLAHDLTPETLQALGLEGQGAPSAEALSAAAAAPALGKHDSIRILLLPEVEKTGAGYQIRIEWRDLPTGKRGSVSERAGSPAELIPAAGRAAAGAATAWRAVWKGPAAGKGAAQASVIPLSKLTSDRMDALAAWSKAGVAWSGGDVPAAEQWLLDALAADPGFDRARVDLAWIRLAQERRADAAALARDAMQGGRLAAPAAALASIIEAAAAQDAAALERLAATLEAEAPASPLGPMARGIALNLTGVHERAVAALDPIRLHRPNDPALLHQAGMAALGVADDYESVRLLARAARLWPQHDRIVMDLADAKLRARDMDGAGAVMQDWSRGFDPTRPPIWGGEWGPEDPPPTVRAAAILTLQGAIGSAVETLGKESSALSLSSAPVGVRMAVLFSLHELQMQLAWGPELEKQRWLNAARASLKALEEILPPGYKEARPWFLDRLSALLRVREGRLQEARDLREKILGGADLPGYDPAIEAEIQTAISLKEADTETYFAAAARAVAARDLLLDRYQVAQGHLMARAFDKTEEGFKIMEDRLRFWSAARRRDAYFWSPVGAALVPFIYYLGAETGVQSGQVAASRERFGIFLAFFRRPDTRLEDLAREAADRGAVPAW